MPKIHLYSSPSSICIISLSSRHFSIIGLNVLRSTSGLAEQLRETTIFGIFPLVVVVGAAVTLLAFTPEGIVVGF